MNEVKKRHICVSIWLWLVVIVNLCLGIYNAIIMFHTQLINQVLGLGVMSALCICNVLGTILLFRWNKNGFLLLVLVTFLSVLVNIYLLHKDIVIGFQSLYGIIIWFGILQIKKNGISAWSLMEKGWDYKHCRHLYQVFSIAIGLILVLSGIVFLTIYKSTPTGVDFPIEDTLAVNIEKSKEEKYWLEDSLQWYTFYDAQKACMIEAPGHFEEVQFNKDQILGLMSKDSEPAIVVIQEPVKVLKKLGISSVEEYADVIVQNNQKMNTSESFQKIKEEALDRNAYLIVYEMSIDGISYRYNVLTTHTDLYYYSCQVFCLSEYADKLQPQISRMLNSFKPIK